MMTYAIRAPARGFISRSLTNASESPTSLPSPYAQPSRTPLLHRRRPLSGDLSSSQKAHPILLPEGPPERHRPIMAHKPMPPHPPKHPTTPLRALQIIDKP